MNAGSAVPRTTGTNATVKFSATGYVDVAHVDDAIAIDGNGNGWHEYAAGCERTTVQPNVSHLAPDYALKVWRTVSACAQR